jgi:serine/threonine protein kinase
MDEPLQKSLERYDVLDRIAVGGMAEVFLAKAYGAHGFEKTLAIKRILPELARDPEFAARFIAEAKVAVKLSHANVVQVFDFGRIGESLFIAMEYVDGLDLAAMLHKYKSEKRLVPLPAAFHIAIEIVRALDFAHTHNVVHRDVSPSNILISRAGEVKIADFGIAVAARPHRGSLPGPRRVMGKWRYMSPEQTRGDTLDTRSDLFSAASVMFELFTGEKLFPGDEAEDIIKNIHDMPIPRASSLRPGLPSRLDEILAGPLARKPIDRPNRPAVVLRSLIELSYESSIMATAMDVADAIAAIIPPPRKSGPGAQLDDVIRKQLGEKQEKSVARRTAVTSNKPTETAVDPGGSTGLFRKLDIDGVSRLEEVSVEAEVDPTAIRSPRARRNSEVPDTMPGDSTDLHALYGAQHDPDRHTEVGGPPTGQVPKAGESILTDKRKALPAKPKSRAPLFVVIALLALALGGVGVYLATRPPAPEEVKVVPPIDASAPVETMGAFEIDSTPSGATITVGDQKPQIGPVKAKVPIGVKVHVKIEHAGFVPVEDDYVAEAGKTQVIRPRLVAAPASLHVVTDPPGALVVLAGRTLGESPNTFGNLEPKRAEALLVSKPNYISQTLKIDLKAGEVTEVNIELKGEPKFGNVTIKVTGSSTWADVFFRGNKLGRNRTSTGLMPFKLPVGRQQLVLVDNNKKQKTIVVDVDEKLPLSITTSFD